VSNPTARAGRKRLLIVLIVLLPALVAVAGGAYLWLIAQSPRQLGPSERVTIASIRYPGNCPTIAAQAKGFFAAEGLLVTLQWHSSGRATVESALTGQAELATTGDLPVLFAVMNRKPVTVVASVATAEGDLGVVANKAKGISASADLKGKRIGVTLGTAGQFLLDALLARSHLSSADVVMKNLTQEEMGAALARGDIDAASSWQPYLGGLQAQLGPNATLFPSTGLYDVALLLVGSRDYVANNAQTIGKVLRAFMAGAKFCEQFSSAAQELVASALKPDTPDLKALWPSYRFKVNLDQSLVLALEDESRWAIKNGIVGRTDMPNWLEHIDLHPLMEINAAAVTIIR
jgi:NitT/TauT family transport system substrate-binding protein